jgi:hypothetical protein
MMLGWQSRKLTTTVVAVSIVSDQMSASGLNEGNLPLSRTLVGAVTSLEEQS